MFDDNRGIPSQPFLTTLHLAKGVIWLFNSVCISICKRREYCVNWFHNFPFMMLFFPLSLTPTSFLLLTVHLTLSCYNIEDIIFQDKGRMPKQESGFGSILDFRQDNVHSSSFIPFEVRNKSYQLLWNKFSSVLSRQSVLFSIENKGEDSWAFILQDCFKNILLFLLI